MTPYTGSAETDVVSALNRWNAHFATEPLACPRDGRELVAVPINGPAWTCPTCTMTQDVTEEQLTAALGAIDLPTPTTADRPIPGRRRNGRLDLGLPRPALLGPGRNLDTYGLVVAVATTVVFMVLILIIARLIPVPAGVFLSAWTASCAIGYLGYATTRRDITTGYWTPMPVTSVEPGMWIAPHTGVRSVAQVRQVTAAQLTGLVTITYSDGTTYSRPRGTVVAQLHPNHTPSMSLAS